MEVLVNYHFVRLVAHLLTWRSLMEKGGRFFEEQKICRSSGNNQHGGNYEYRQ